MSCKFGTFVAGALVGAATALMLAPESGDRLRARIRRQLKKLGDRCCKNEKELEDLVEELAEELTK